MYLSDNQMIPSDRPLRPFKHTYSSHENLPADVTPADGDGGGGGGELFPDRCSIKWEEVFVWWRGRLGMEGRGGTQVHKGERIIENETFLLPTTRHFLLPASLVVPRRGLNHADTLPSLSEQ